MYAYFQIKILTKNYYPREFFFVFFSTVSTSGKEIEDLTLEAEAFARDVVALGAVWVYAERTAVAGDALHPRVAPEVLFALVAPPPSKSGPAHVFFIAKYVFSPKILQISLS
jgi:hypothetical protein